MEVVVTTKFLVHLWSNKLSRKCLYAVLEGHPCRVVSISYCASWICHGRGREFESRRPRQLSYTAITSGFGQTFA